jgi:hypothetical protein
MPAIVGRAQPDNHFRRAEPALQNLRMSRNWNVSFAGIFNMVGLYPLICVYLMYI